MPAPAVKLLRFKRISGKKKAPRATNLNVQNVNAKRLKSCCPLCHKVFMLLEKNAHLRQSEIAPILNKEILWFFIKDGYGVYGAADKYKRGYH